MGSYGLRGGILITIFFRGHGRQDAPIPRYALWRAVLFTHDVAIDEIAPFLVCVRLSQLDGLVTIRKEWTSNRRLEKEEIHV
jgi:hypothetical protein